MLVGGIVLAVVLAAVAVALVTRQRSHDDVHSVEHYHRQLHTLEGMNAHPAGSDLGRGSTDAAKPAYPGSALRPAGTKTVRITDAVKPDIPPIAPPPVPDGAEPVKFDDAETPLPPPPPGAGPMWRQDRTMEAINHRPRRLAAPATALAAVIVLVGVLLITGSHSTAPPRHHKSSTGTSATHTSTPRTVPATTLPLISPATQVSATSATYTVGMGTFSVVLTATTGQCWFDATTAGGSTLFTGILAPGQTHTVVVTGPVSVEAGAPGSFTAAINGSAITLPAGYQAPFTLHFLPAPSTTAS